MFPPGISGLLKHVMYQPTLFKIVRLSAESRVTVKLSGEL